MENMQNKSGTASIRLHVRPTVHYLLVSYLRSQIFHWPRKKVYSSYYYPAYGSPSGETLAQRILAWSEQASRNVPE